MPECGIKEEKHYRKLDIHHIDYNKKNCKKNNLVTLCQSCHSKAGVNRDYWYAYYTYLMESINA
jgi:5-methylcytosine-specific restriction endonuclease McrA